MSILLLAAVAPLARMYNAATRAYASVVEPKKEVRDEWHVLDDRRSEDSSASDDDFKNLII